jgi:hypothetical protein
MRWSKKRVPTLVRAETTEGCIAARATGIEEQPAKARNDSIQPRFYEPCHFPSLPPAAKPVAV